MRNRENLSIAVFAGLGFVACGLMGILAVGANSDMVNFKNGGWVLATEGTLPGNTNVEVFVGRDAGGLSGFGIGVSTVQVGPNGAVKVSAFTCDQKFGCTTTILPVSP